MIERNELTQRAMGGTELMAERIASVGPGLLEGVQLIHSRVRDLKDGHKHVLVLHDLPGDPEVQHLANGGWEKFDRLVFVSHWQQQMYNVVLGVPYEAGVVIENAIEPFTSPRSNLKQAGDQIDLIYFSTPHRGLDVLHAAFERLSDADADLHLHVYSSFALYGWENRDKPFETLFNALKANPQVTVYPVISNAEIRKVLPQMDILAYPSTWPETSCLCLIESMMAGLHCVHSSLGALPETSGGLTSMYQFTEDKLDHVDIFSEMLERAIGDVRIGVSTDIGRTVAEQRFSWSVAKEKWSALLKEIKQ